MQQKRNHNCLLSLFFFLALSGSLFAGNSNKGSTKTEDSKSVIVKAHETALQYGKAGKTKKAIAELEKIIETAKASDETELLGKTYEYLIIYHQKNGTIKKAEEYKYLLGLLQTAAEKKKLENLYKENKQTISKLKEQNKNTEVEKQKTEEELNRQAMALLQTKDSLEVLDIMHKERLAQINLLQKEKEIEKLVLKEKDARLKQQELAISEKEARQNLFILAVVGLSLGIIILAVLAYFIYKNLRQKKEYSRKMEEQLKVIQQQHENITNSINYASRIQNAMLPHEKSFGHLFNDSFVLLKPKDIVSGDFFWFFDVTTENSGNEFLMDNDPAASTLSSDNPCEKVIVVAADCTGHGVPGALMSMIGYNLLNTIAHRKIYEPDQILTELNKGIRIALQQYKNNNQDGMDIALCVIDRKNKVIEYAGAKNPIVIIQNGQLQHIKGDKHTIGGSQGDSKRIYTKHTFPIEGDTFIYLFSDGYEDQFGGPDNRKFMTKNLKELLLKNHQLPFNTQQDILDKVIEDWKGTKEKQIDDILVMGMKVSSN